MRSEDDEVGFSLKLGPDSALGLDALSVNDRTLWTSKLTEACSNFEETEKSFHQAKVRQVSIQEGVGNGSSD